MRDKFNAVASRITEGLGSPYALIIAVMVIVVWAASGPFFDFSQTWQILINTGTTIATFLMVFVLQNSQNRDSKAVHLKLDELIRAIDPARNSMITAEKSTEKELATAAAEFAEIAKDAAHEAKDVAEEATEK